MKTLRCVMLLLAALLLLPTAVSADEPEYTFVLTANGADSCRAAAGDIVTVTLAVRCDSGTDAVYAAQDEIVFDPAFFAFEPDSVLTRSGVKTSTLHLRDGRQAVYMSFISYGSAADWAGETVLGSFRLRVLAEDGTGALCSSNYLVSSQDPLSRRGGGRRRGGVGAVPGDVPDQRRRRYTAPDGLPGQRVDAAGDARTGGLYVRRMVQRHRSDHAVAGDDPGDGGHDAVCRVDGRGDGIGAGHMAAGCRHIAAGGGAGVVQPTKA